MFIDSIGNLYAGDIRVSDREATAEEIAAWEQSKLPTPAEQIRALELQYADAQAKLTRQSLLTLALDKACADPLAENLTRDQVHAFLLTGDNGYAALWDLEQQIVALRGQM